MEGPSTPPPHHSHSTPAIPQYPVNNGPPLPDPQLHRPHSASTASASVRRPEHGSNFTPPNAPAFRETWRDPYPNMRMAGESSRSNDAGPAQPPRLELRGEGSRPHGNSMGTLNEARTVLMAEQRKRRLTAPDTPGRAARHAPPSFGASLVSSAAAASVGRIQTGMAAGPGRETTVIDLTGDDSPQRQNRTVEGNSYGPVGSNPSGRKPSDIVLPPWQPDSEVQECPVCGKAFGFWYRKHHCR